MGNTHLQGAYSSYREHTAMEAHSSPGSRKHATHVVARSYGEPTAHLGTLSCWEHTAMGAHSYEGHTAMRSTQLWEHTAMRSTQFSPLSDSPKVSHDQGPCSLGPKPNLCSQQPEDSRLQRGHTDCCVSFPLSLTEPCCWCFHPHTALSLLLHPVLFSHSEPAQRALKAHCT